MKMIEDSKVRYNNNNNQNYNVESLELRNAGMTVYAAVGSMD